MIQRLSRLEAALLSDAWRAPKLLILQALLIALCVTYALAGSALRRPSLIGALGDPPSHAGLPLSFSFTHLRTAPPSTGFELEMETAAGWLPVRTAPPGARPGEVISVAGTLLADSSFAIETLERHPRRGGKVWVSLGTLVALAALVLWRWRQLLRALRMQGVYASRRAAGPSRS